MLVRFPFGVIVIFKIIVIYHFGKTSAAFSSFSQYAEWEKESVKSGISSMLNHEEFLFCFLDLIYEEFHTQHAMYLFFLKMGNGVL